MNCFGCSNCFTRKLKLFLNIFSNCKISLSIIFWDYNTTFKVLFLITLGFENSALNHQLLIRFIHIHMIELIFLKTCRYIISIYVIVLMIIKCNKILAGIFTFCKFVWDLNRIKELPMGHMYKKLLYCLKYISKAKILLL